MECVIIIECVIKMLLKLSSKKDEKKFIGYRRDVNKLVN